MNCGNETNFSSREIYDFNDAYYLKWAGKPVVSVAPGVHISACILFTFITFACIQIPIHSSVLDFVIIKANMP